MRSLKRDKQFILFLSVLLAVACSSKEDLDSEPDYLQHISICVLGNSYSLDAYSYVPFILKSHYISCDIHIYYRGGCSLLYLYNGWDAEPLTHYSIDTRIDAKWSQSEPMNPAQLVALKKWDIISLQQSSMQVCDENTYYPYLPEIVGKLESLCPYDFKLAWFMAINRASNLDIVKNLQTQRKIVEQQHINLVLPVATAIFDCQCNPYLRSIGEGTDGRLYCSDDVHLQEGLPCYIAALTIAQALLDQYATGQTVLNDTLRPTQKWIKSVNGLAPNGSSVGVTETNCAIAQKAAVLANKNKFEIVEID